MAQAEPLLRVLSPEEAPAANAFIKKVGWDHALEQSLHYILWSGQGSFCLDLDNQIVATALALKYSDGLAWIGSVVSDPTYQRRGFARRLMNHVMTYLQGIDSIMLDASTLGFPLYDSMGFQSLYKINVYSGVPQHFERPPSIRPMTADDLSTVIAMDCDVVGAARPQVFQWLFETGKGYVTTEADAITGYTFTKTHADALRLAAWNARDAAAAEALLQICSNAAAENGYKLHISIPEPNTHACDMASRHNLTIDRYVTRMVFGKPPPGHMSDQYGIISFMTG